MVSEGEDPSVEDLLSEARVALVRRALAILAKKNVEADELREARLILKDAGVHKPGGGKPSDPIAELFGRYERADAAPLPTSEEVNDPYEDMN